MRTLLLVTLAMLTAAPLAAQATAEQSGDAVEEVVVTGIPPRCRPRAGDPQDLVDLSGAASRLQQQVIRIDLTTGRYGLFPDDYPLGTRDEWQRDGTGLDRFVFRVPEDGSAACIGTRSRDWRRFAQLRRAFSARPLWGKYVILTASVAARKAGRVDMWIAAGAPVAPRAPDEPLNNIVAGGPKPVPLKGDYEWRRVNFLMGPIPCMADQVSYGVTLRGGGDVWLSEPRFIEVPEASLSLSMRARPHGAEMLKTDPICRHYLDGEPLWIFRDGGYVWVVGPEVVAPGAVLFSREPLSETIAKALKGSGWRYEPFDYQRSFSPGIVEF